MTSSLPTFPSDLDLSGFGLLDPDTSVFPKDVRPGPLLALPDAALKWYEIAPSGTDLANLPHRAKTFLEAESLAGNLVLEHALGFVKLHHCTTIAFLIVMTWRRNNELWQTTYAIDLRDRESGFTRVTESVRGHRPGLCIWEQVPVWHERSAWIRYIGSARDDTAKRTYLADLYAGPC